MKLHWLYVISLIALSSGSPTSEQITAGDFPAPFSLQATSRSVALYKIKLDETSNERSLDKKPSMKLVFHEDAGSPRWSPACSNGSYCVQWMKNGMVNGEILINPFNNPPSNPDNRWKAVFSGPPHTYLIDYDGYYLYGGPVDNIYPSNGDLKRDAPSVTSEGGRVGLNLASGVVERIWAATNGHSVRVSDYTPLFFSQDKTTLELTVKSELPYPRNQINVKSELILCLKTNIKEAWECISEDNVKPVPDIEVMRYPTLTTWVTYKSDISQEIVLELAKKADDNKIPISVLGIDDGWETCYGSQIFNKKFPDPKTIVSELAKRDQQVTLWVHPFVNLECEAYDRLKDYLLRYDNGSIVNTTWWNGRGGLINFLDPKAESFYYNRLKKLQDDYGITGFKFDAGEISYIHELNEALTLDLPNEYTKKYIALAAKFGPIGEVRVGAGTVSQNIRLRLQDTNSVWDLKNLGLRSVIPSMLQLTILGYNALIPDMVGGNAYGTNITQEMFIRWLQMNTFMPYVQLSFPPWNFDSETMQQTQKLLELHSKYSDSLYWTTRRAPKKQPTIAPMWWIDPTDQRAQLCDDQFLLGPDLLVAPVVEEGAVSRNIYFPTGTWVDGDDGKTTYTGPTVVENFPAPLSKLPWFTKQGPAPAVHLVDA